MAKKSFKLKINSAVGSVSAECIIPSKSKCIITLAHGAGAGMHHEFMVSLSESLASENIATMRFNFPFMEKKKGAPDKPAVAHLAIAAAIEKAQEMFPGVPLFAAGKSFGGRMTSQYMATNPANKVKGIIFYGFPLHASGKPSIERADHLKDVKVPLLFLQGTRDELASWDLIKSVCSKLKTATLVKIEGANHAFKAGKVDVMSILVQETIKWII